MAAQVEPKIEALYKLVIVGGGPAGIGVLIRAARIGLLDRLMDPVHFGKPEVDLKRSQELHCVQKGVALLHDQDARTFGSGRLGLYLNNSNIFAKAFVAAILDDKNDADPRETIKGTCLESMVNHEIIQRMEFIGSAQACLVDFGNVLHAAGECFEKHFWKLKESSSLMLRTGVSRVEILANGLFRVHAKSYETETTTELYAEHVVLATGGQQRLPSLGNPKLDAKLFASDECLIREGFVKLKQFLMQSENHQVCIVGGSHSSFSVAWMLLNKWNADYAKLETPSPVDGAALTPATITTGSCKDQQDSTFFKAKDITILHRSTIRCYYATKREAEADGVTGLRADRAGSVNCFTGIREDAKRLYRDIQAGKEKRVRLIHVNKDGNQAINQKAYETCAAIVWSCGYQTNLLPICDPSGQDIKLFVVNGVVKCDGHGCLQKCIDENGAHKVETIPKLFGIGLGYYLRAEVDEMGEETKVDGVAVYHRQGAMHVLAEVFGHEAVYGVGCHSYTEMLEKADRLQKEKATREAQEAKEAKQAEKAVEELPPVVIKGSVKSLEKVTTSPRDFDIGISSRTASRFNSGNPRNTTSTSALKTSSSTSHLPTNPSGRSLSSQSKLDGTSDSSSSKTAVAPLEETGLNGGPRRCATTPPLKKVATPTGMSSPRGPGKKQVVASPEATN